MSSPLAIGAVSAVLRNLLDNGLIDVGAPLGRRSRSRAVAPDTIKLDDADAPPRLNLFLYRVTPNQGWRNVGLPHASTATARGVTNPPLALDLHYLLTAYGARRLPGRDPARLRDAPAARAAGARPRARSAARSTRARSAPSILPPAFQALTASDLADQVEAVTITPSRSTPRRCRGCGRRSRRTTGRRPAYLVSVVLIEARPARRDRRCRCSRAAGPTRSPARARRRRRRPSLVPPFPTHRPGRAARRAAGRAPRRAVATSTGHHLDGTVITVVRFAPPAARRARSRCAVGDNADPDRHRRRRCRPSAGPGADAATGRPASTRSPSTLTRTRAMSTPRRTNVGRDAARARAADLPPTTITRDADDARVTVDLDVAPAGAPDPEGAC